MSIDLISFSKLVSEVNSDPMGKIFELPVFKSRGKCINGRDVTQLRKCKESMAGYKVFIKIYFFIRSICSIRLQVSRQSFCIISINLLAYPKSMEGKFMLKIIEHPFIQHYLAILRQHETPVAEFRRSLGKIALFLFYEAARGLLLRTFEVTTPLEKIEGAAVARKIHLIGILRAALGMIEGIIDHVPNVDVGHVGIYRDEETLAPQKYYSRLPPIKSGEPVFIIDPMLATGGSMVTAIEIVKKAGADNIAALTLIAAPEGIDFVHRRYADLTIYTAALDRELNAQGYILPGLGDAGDRQFGTS